MADDAIDQLGFARVQREPKSGRVLKNIEESHTLGQRFTPIETSDTNNFV